MLALLGATAIADKAVAQSTDHFERPDVNFRGTQGMVDMPTAHGFIDGDVSLTNGFLNRDFRTTLAFQLAPRITGAFRYGSVYDLNGTGVFWDRSFDVHVLLAEETERRPAIAVGLQDFAGTGVYSGEYLVGTKTFGRLRATLGMGWGRLASYNGFSNPLGVIDDRFETRPGGADIVQNGGQLRTETWFRGDAALFGGIQYAYSDRLMLSAEYSSDAYRREVVFTDFDHDSPFNFSATYRFRNGANLTAGLLNGSNIAVQLNYVTNPRFPRRARPDRSGTPQPILVRSPGASRDLGWTQQADAEQILRQNVAEVFELSGLRLDAFGLSERAVTVHVRNTAYRNEAQALGRAARQLAGLMPSSIETFNIVLVTSNGLPANRVTLKRSDLEQLEFAPDGSWQSFARADFDGDAGADATPVSQSFPDFTWGIGPYLLPSYFDPEQPFRLDVGLEFSARYEPVPGLVFNGAIRQRLAGNIEEGVPSNSVIQRVRSDGNLYAQEDLTLDRLTASYFFRPNKNLYGRVTLGYLERMYGGLSSELLWKPVDSRIAFGAELNYVAQRDFDQRFGFQDYDVITGHASAYFDTGKGYHFQIDAGRYLAGDWGATFTLDREFENGVVIGAFATFTDVSFDDFGEGSFDKGIHFRIPTGLLSGQVTRNVTTQTIRPVQRDGGARLSVDDRLYSSVRALHQPDLQDEWGRFWR